MPLADDALETALRQQIAALVEVCATSGTTIRSVKAHGALYGEVGQGGPVFGVLCSVIDALCPAGTRLVLPAFSPALVLAQRQGRSIWAEGFCDRAYADDGALMDRALPGAVFHDPEQAAAQARRLVAAGSVDTLCIHGDSAGAVAMAGAVRRDLEASGITVSAGNGP
jgi:UPF0271 protein